jgi:hypothetical protein
MCSQKQQQRLLGSLKDEGIYLMITAEPFGWHCRYGRLTHLICDPRSSQSRRVIRSGRSTPPYSPWPIIVFIQVSASL